MDARTACALIAATLVASAATSRAAAQYADPAEMINFDRDVRPIFKTHCYHCHGPEKQEAGLRLDAKRYAIKGGTSGQPLLSPKPEFNEIYHRITSHDPNYRMPRDAEPLSSGEVATITQWVLAGCPWPSDPENDEADEESVAWIWSTLKMLKSFQVEIGLVLCFCLLVLWLQRRKTIAQEHQAAGKTLPRFARICSNVRPSHHVISGLILCCLLLATLWTRHHYNWQSKLADREDEIDRLSQRLARFDPEETDVTSDAIYGNPPKPFHPGHPARVQNVYYRGNCERNPRLNNLGNYRTATFRLSLVDDLGKPIQPGDEVRDRKLALKLEVERAPYTSDALFSERIMGTVFLTKFFDRLPTKEEDDRVALREIELGKRWAVEYPITLGSEANPDVKGLIYVFKGFDTSMKGGRVHYGIQYALRVENGRLQRGSEVWMNSLFWEPHLARPQPGKVPLTEWFNHYPIPVLTRANTNDPRLIGIGDYVKEKNTEPDPLGPSAN